MSEISDTATLVKLSTEGTYYLIKGSVKGILYLYQTLKKLNAAKVLGNGEVENFEKFLKATEGKYKILNVPTEDPEEIARMKSDLDKLHIGYTVLPDLNVGDGQIQVAYAIEDMDKIESWYRSFCLDHLQSGGEKSYRDLVNLTDGQISIVNIPWPDVKATVENTEDPVYQIKEALKEENTDFSKGVLPDLNKKEKNITVMVPSYRTEDMKEWYRNYNDSQEELQVQSINDYLGTGMLDEYTYVETADRKNKRILKPELDLSQEPAVTEGERTINKLLGLPDEKITVATLNFPDMQPAILTDLTDMSEKATRGAAEALAGIITEEGRVQKLKADLDNLHINYTILPDLNVGDGYIQIAYAAADAPKLKAWYEAYQSNMLAAGTPVEDMREISLEEYQKTKSEKVVKESGRSTKANEYEQIRNQSGMVELSINKGLVKNADAALPEGFESRIPGSREYFRIKPDFLFGADDGKTYGILSGKDTQIQILDEKGAFIRHGKLEDISGHYDPIRDGMGHTEKEILYRRAEDKNPELLLTETKDLEKTVRHKAPSAGNKNRFNNFDQRDYSSSFFENLEQVAMNKTVDEPKIKTPFEAFLDKKEQQSLSGMSQAEEIITAAVPEKVTVKTAEKTMEQLVEKVLVGPKI